VSEPDVLRSVVSAEKNYRAYMQPLRRDFIYSCAYCTLSECESGPSYFAIDHYIPKSARADLVNDYNNLMYSCAYCNNCKSDIVPSPAGVAAGNRYIKIDQEAYCDHVELKGNTLVDKTQVGWFSIEYLELNRYPILRTRQIRRDYNIHEYVRAGVRALRDYPIDQLPRNFRVRALYLGKEAERVACGLLDDITEIMRNIAASPMNEPDPDSSRRAEARGRGIAAMASMFPDADWRGRLMSKGKPATSKVKRTKHKKKKR
jgi:hypothetical protein